MNCKKIKGQFGPITFIRNYQNLARSQHPLNVIFSEIFVRMKESKCIVLKNPNGNQNTLQVEEKQSGLYLAAVWQLRPAKGYFLNSQEAFFIGI